ncbi:hypothetical protein GCM10027456_61290 [Kineosporia babensis]
MIDPGHTGRVILVVTDLDVPVVDVLTGCATHDPVLTFSDIADLTPRRYLSVERVSRRARVGRGSVSRAKDMVGEVVRGGVRSYGHRRFR